MKERKDQLISPYRAAEILQIGTAALRKLRADGEIEYAGRQKYWLSEVVELARRRGTPASDDLFAEQYPQHARADQWRDSVQPVKRFLRWLQDSPKYAVVLRDGGWPVTGDIERLASEWAGIDHDQLEIERRQIAAEQRRKDDTQ